MPADVPVARSSLSNRIQPISVRRPMPLVPHRIWSEDDWRRIQLGYHARDMDEKWDVFAEGDVVYLHRSWTGRGIFEATFVSTDASWRIVEAMVEGDRARYRNEDDEYDCLMLELVLSAIVLGEPAQELRTKLVELTRKRAGNAEVPGGLVQHSALGLRS